MAQIEELLNLLSEDIKPSFIGLYEKIKNQMEAMPASVSFHHIWRGGLHQHVEEVMNIALELFVKFKSNLEDVTLNDILIVAFIHDLDKLEKYEPRIKSKKKSEEPYYPFQYRENYNINYFPIMEVMRILSEEHIILSNLQIDALAWHHGGWSEVSHYYNDCSKLAIIIHTADLISAKIIGKAQKIANAKK